MKKFSLLILFLFCSGCINPYVKYYRDQTNGVDVTTDPRVILPTEEPKIIAGKNVNLDNAEMFENGYKRLGYSSFNAGDVGEDKLMEQAKKVDAEIAIYYSRYTNTITGSIPLTLPDNQTTTTNYSGNVYGNGSTASYYGSTTSTTYGTTTVDIPYSQNRYDYMATFWIKTKPPIFGVNLKDLDSELREKIGSNKGVVVAFVIKDTPAFFADILKGDILLKLNNSEIIDSKTFTKLTHEFAGQIVKVKLFRNGKQLSKKIKLNSIEK